MTVPDRVVIFTLASVVIAWLLSGGTSNALGVGCISWPGLPNINATINAYTVTYL